MSASDTGETRLEGETTAGTTSVPARPARRGRWVARGLWLVAIALVAVGIWRLWIDLRPLPEIGAIGRMMEKGDLEEARSNLHAWLARSPHHGEARRMLAMVYARQEDLRQCADHLHLVPAWWPGKRVTSFLEGESYQKLDLARLAERAWRVCVADDPLHPAPSEYFNGAAKALVALYVLEGRRDAAREVLWEVYPQAALDERAAILGTHLRVEIERIEPKEAIATLSRYLAADPKDWEARLALAANLQDVGAIAESDRHIQVCLAERPNDVAVWRTWLQILTARNDPAGVAEALKRMPEGLAKAEDAALQSIRGAALEAAGDLDAAAAALRKSLALNPFDDEAHYRLARVARRLGHTEAEAVHRKQYEAIRKAREDLAPALAEYRRLVSGAAGVPDRREVLARLAGISEALGRERLAREWRRLSAEPVP